MSAATVLEELRLVDHHCHGVVRDELDAGGFEALLSEGGAPAPGLSNFDTQLGLAVRRHCAPLLDLEPLVPPAPYLAQRSRLGGSEVTRRLLRAAGTGTFLVDTGLRPDILLSPPELSAVSGSATREVIRLEAVAEAIADDGVEAGEFFDRFEGGLAGAVATAPAVAVKTIAAYRVGLDFDPRPPTRQEVKAAADQWLARGPGPRGWRLDDSVLTRAILWSAVELGLPIQLHTGFGDRDVALHRANPALLTEFIRAVSVSVPIVLLHCYPYHREAAYLANVYPHVFCDMSLALTHVGPTHAAQVLGEAMELTPFGKLLYASDAFGLPELYYLAALAFRRAMSEVLDAYVDAGEWTSSDAERVARLVGADNAERVYRLATGPAPDRH